MVVTKLNREQCLQALYGASKPQGYGILHYKPGGLTIEECKEALSRGEYIDYLVGRVIKCNFEDFPNKLSLSLFDRDNGQGSGAKAIADKEKELGL